MFSLKWKGFQGGTQEKIEAGIFKKLKKKQPFWQRNADTNSRQVFRLFSKPPIDTGGTQKDTKARSFMKGNNLVFRFSTPNKVPRGWRIFPLLGLSTSKKYGERNWLKKGAKKTLQDITK